MADSLQMDITPKLNEFQPDIRAALRSAIEDAIVQNMLTSTLLKAFRTKHGHLTEDDEQSQRLCQ